MFVFQLPWLPERRLRRAGWDVAVRAMRDTARPGAFTERDLVLYREAWAQPGAARGMIHWYRAALRRPPRKPRHARVRVPTLVVWGALDRFLSRDMVASSLELCDRGEVEWVENATHWVQHEEPDRVNRRLLEFLRKEGTPPF